MDVAADLKQELIALLDRAFPERYLWCVFLAALCVSGESILSLTEQAAAPSVPLPPGKIGVHRGCVPFMSQSPAQGPSTFCHSRAIRLRRGPSPAAVRHSYGSFHHRIAAATFRSRSSGGFFRSIAETSAISRSKDTFSSSATLRNMGKKLEWHPDSPSIRAVGSTATW